MRQFFAGLTLLALAACGGSSDSSTGPTGGNNNNPPPLSASGSWTGVVGTAANAQALSLTLTESTGAVTGIGTLSNTPGGLRALTVTGTEANGAVAWNVSAGAAVQPFNVQGTLSATTIAANLVGAGFTGDAITLVKSGSTVLVAPVWAGTWQLVSDNGVAVGAGHPATTNVLGFAETVYGRTVTLAGDGTGTWADSTTSSLFCAPGSPPAQQCQGGGRATVAWVVNGTTLTLAVNLTSAGRVDHQKTFTLQGDGSLLKTDDSEIEVYKRQ